MVVHTPGQLLRQGILAPAVDHAGQGNGCAHSAFKVGIPVFFTVSRQPQQPPIGLGLLVVPLNRAHAGCQQPHQGGNVHIACVKVDAHLGLRGPSCGNMQGVPLYIGRLCLGLLDAFPGNMWAPLAKAQPAGPLAVHQNTSLGLYHRARWCLCIPADAQLPERRKADFRRGEAPILQIPPCRLFQAYGIFGESHIVQPTLCKSVRAAKDV